VSTPHPTFIMKFTAQPGKRDALIEQAVKGFELASGIERWSVYRDDEDPDLIWVIETFASDEAVEQHRAHQDQDHVNAVGSLMAGPESFTRTTVHAAAASYPLP